MELRQGRRVGRGEEVEPKLGRRGRRRETVVQVAGQDDELTPNQPARHLGRHPARPDGADHVERVAEARSQRRRRLTPHEAVSPYT
jgi:hypothetical protein